MLLYIGLFSIQGPRKLKVKFRSNIFIFFQCKNIATMVIESVHSIRRIQIRTSLRCM